MYGLACSFHMCGGAAAEAPNKGMEPDALQRPLRSRFRARLMPGVRCLTKISGQRPNRAMQEYHIHLGWYILTATCTGGLPLLTVFLCYPKTLCV